MGAASVPTAASVPAVPAAHMGSASMPAATVASASPMSASATTMSTTATVSTTSQDLARGEKERCQHDGWHAQGEKCSSPHGCHLLGRNEVVSLRTVARSERDG
jgi:hypothetical protein